MTGAVTWDVLQWLVYGGIAVALGSAGAGAGVVMWLQRQFNQVREDAHGRTRAVITTVNSTTLEIRKELGEFKDQFREEIDKLRTETHEQNAKIRERLTMVETIVARFPR
jgi:hypothetical protein